MQSTDAGVTVRAASQNACFACGQENRGGLRIAFARGDDGSMMARWMPEPVWEGFRGIVHGGVVSTVLDEAMSKAVAAGGTEALTAELRVRFRKPVSTGGPYLIRGWIVSRTKRLIETEAALTTPAGAELAHAWGRFLSVPQAHSQVPAGSY